MTFCVCDIGGTNFRIALYEGGRIFSVNKKATPNFNSCQYDTEATVKAQIVRDISNGFREFSAQGYDIRGMAVCFPGPTDSDGCVLGSSVIFGDTLSEPFRLKSELEARLPGVPIIVMNDMTAAAYRYRALYRDFCLITVSSGIGNKICIDGKVLIDKRGRTGEIGHISAELDGFNVDCTCGTGKNHVGMISSGRGAEYFANELYEHDVIFGTLYSGSTLKGDRITSHALAAAADGGDAYARAVIDFCTAPLAKEICLLTICMDLPRFIIIGGFALNCAYYIESLICNVIKEGVYNFSPEELRSMIVLGYTDDDHGLIGAGIIAEERINNNL